MFSGLISAPCVPGRVRATVDADGDAILAFALHPNDREVVVACKSGLVKHWRLGAAAHDAATAAYADADPSEWLDASEHDDDFAESVAADAASAAAAENEGEAAPNKQHTLVRSFKGHEMDVTEIAFDLSATLIATASLDRTIRVRFCVTLCHCFCDAYHCLCLIFLVKRHIRNHGHGLYSLLAFLLILSSDLWHFLACRGAGPTSRCGTSSAAFARTCSRATTSARCVRSPFARASSGCCSSRPTTRAVSARGNCTPHPRHPRPAAKNRARHRPRSSSSNQRAATRWSTTWPPSPVWLLPPPATN